MSNRHNQNPFMRTVNSLCGGRGGGDSDDDIVCIKERDPAEALRMLGESAALKPSVQNHSLRRRPMTTPEAKRLNDEALAKIRKEKEEEDEDEDDSVMVDLMPAVRQQMLADIEGMNSPLFRQGRSQAQQKESTINSIVGLDFDVTRGNLLDMSGLSISDEEGDSSGTPVKTPPAQATKKKSKPSTKSKARSKSGEEDPKVAAERFAKEAAIHQNSAEQFYLKCNNDPQALFAMCYNIKASDGSGRILGDVAVSPHKDLQVEGPKRPHYADECGRRAEIIAAKWDNPKKRYRKPKPTNWSITQSKKFLDENPITDDGELSFIEKTERKFFQDSQKALEEKIMLDGQRTKSWSDPFPFLRLYEAASEDNAKTAFLADAVALNQQQLDARNNDYRPSTFWQVAAANFNDPNKVYYTEPLPKLHSLFKDPIALKFEDTPGAITAENAKERLNSARVALIDVITNWETSGTGCGARDIEDDQFGRLDDDVVQVKGDNRSDYLGRYQPHVLYYWHKMDKQDILGKVLSILKKDIAASSTKPAARTVGVENSRKKKGGDADDDVEKESKKYKEDIGSSMKALAYDSSVGCLADLQKELQNTELAKLDLGEPQPTDPWIVKKKREVFDGMISRLNEQISSQKEHVAKCKKDMLEE